MKAAAILDAKDRLEWAREAIPEMTTNAKRFTKAWFEYLDYVDTIYDRLKNGAMGIPKSWSWYKQTYKDALNDELLCYLHHARNAERHGLEPSRGLGAPKLSRVDNSIKTPPAGQVLLRVNPQITFAMTPPPIRLVPVTDRQGKIYGIPKRHLGKKLPSMSIPDLATLALKYFEGKLMEAEQLKVD